MKKVKIELQFFEGCPNYKIMNENLRKATEGLEQSLEILYTNVEDEETALKSGFRGSPTLLIDEEDVEGVPIPLRPSLACRFYAKGVPSADMIREIILMKLRNKK